MRFMFCWNFMKLLVYKLKGKSHLHIYLGRCHCSLTRPIIIGTSQIKQEYNYCKRLASIGEQSPVIFFHNFVMQTYQKCQSSNLGGFSFSFLIFFNWRLFFAFNCLKLLIPSNTIFLKFGDNFVCCGCVKDCSCYNTLLKDGREGGRGTGQFVCLFCSFLVMKTPVRKQPLGQRHICKTSIFPKIASFSVTNLSSFQEAKLSAIMLLLYSAY